MKELNQRKVGSLLSYLQMALGILVGIIYTPLMIRALGQSEYGLYNTVASTISVIYLLNMGFNSGYIKYYAKYKTLKDEDAIARLNGLFIIIFSIIGLISLLCGIFISQNLDVVFDKGLTEKEYDIAKILTIILTINMSVSFPMSVFSTIVSAHERFIYLKLIATIKTVLSPALVLPLLLLGYRSIAMAAVSTAVAIIADGCYLFYTFIVLKQKFTFKNFEKGIFKSLFIYVSFIAINMIVDQINWNIDKLLLGRFKGTSAVALYSVGYSIYHYYQMFSTSISGVFTPKIHILINQYKNDKRRAYQEISDLFIKVGRIQFLLLALIVTGFIIFGKKFIWLWAGEDYENAYYVALLLIIPASIALTQNLGIEVQRAMNKHQFRSIIYLIMAFVNLFISIVLCQKYGAIGSAIGTAFSLIFANGIIMNIFYKKVCRINILLFWKNIIRMSFGLLIPVGLILILNMVTTHENTITYLLKIVLYVFIYSISMWFISMNSYEKSLIYNPFYKIFRSRNDKIR